MAQTMIDGDSDGQGGGGFIGLLLLCLAASWFWDFYPFTGGSLRPIDYEHDYNAYFYDPADKETYLGRVTGLDACGSAARSESFRRNYTSAVNWSYICCSIRKGSQCYEKER